MKRKKAVKREKLFCPNEIATMISLAVKRDLDPLLHEYDGYECRESILARRQVDELRKKFVFDTSHKDLLDLKTFSKFEDVNKHIQNFNDPGLFPDPETRITSKTPYRDKVLLRARALVHHVLSDFDESEWFRACKHGPGSTIGVPFVDTSIERKFTFPITITETAKPFFERYLAFDFQLKEAIDNFNKHNPIGSWYKVEDGSRATTVDKNQDIRRMIAVETTGNMYLQQGLMLLMYARLSKFGLDVKSLPTTHRKLACLSSISCKNATIDFSSASDCVSIELLRWLLPPKWFGLIFSLRSSYMTIQGRKVKLNMISTMGNAVTFPLETLVFWTLAHGVRLSQKRGNSLFPEWEDLSLCSVFGDDCIVPSDCADPFMDVCKSVGFLVNEEKSFTGSVKFRESCGGDYHSGYNVRPFFLKSPSSDRLSALEPWLNIIWNSLLQKYILCFGEVSYIYDKAVFKLLADLGRKYKLRYKLVPSYFPDDAGIKLTYDLERWVDNYVIPLSPIKMSKHGTYSFQFCRFQYWKRQDRDDYIRYTIELRRKSLPDDVTAVSDVDYQEYTEFPEIRGEPFHKYPIRKKGGYVVGKSLSSHWEVPVISRVT